MDKLNLLNIYNIEFKTWNKFHLIYADCIYESHDFSWVDKYWHFLMPNGIFIVQTDYHTVAEMKLYLDSQYNSHFVNWIIYKQEWGGVPRNRFAQKHDDILIYSNGKDWHWDSSGIQIPKATAGTAFDKKGTGMKTPCSVFDDLGNFSTISKERMKNLDGKNIQWQKPEKLLRRLMTPFLVRGMSVLDPFAGTGTSGVIAKELDCHYVGIEYDEDVWGLMWNRLNGDNI